MTVTHVGSTMDYASGWEAIFKKQPGRSKASAAGKPPAKKAAGQRKARGKKSRSR